MIAGSLSVLLAATPAAAQQTAAADDAPRPVSASELQAAIDSIRRRVAEQQAAREGSGASELAAELRSAREAITELTRSMARLRSERDALLADLDGQRVAQSALRAELEAAERSAAATQAQLVATQASAAAASADSAQRLATLDEQLRVGADSVAALEAELLDLRTANKTAEAELVAERDARATLAAELSATRDVVARLEAEQVAASDALAAREAELVAARATAAGLTQALSGEREALASARAELGQLAEARVAAESQLATVTATAAEQAAVLETELAALRDVASNSVAEVSGLGEQLLAVLEENEELVAALAQSRASRSLIEQELAATRRDVEAYADEVTTLRSGADVAAPVALVASDAAIESLDAELISAREQIASLTEELIARDKQLVTRSDAGDADALAERLGLLQREIDRLVSENEAMADELATLRGRTDVAVAELVVASVDANDAADRFLGQLDAVDTGDGWWMTVPDGIVFAPGSEELAPGAEPSLAQVAALLGYFGEAPVRIVGHTDSYGDAEVNRRLSLQRADAVRDFLVERFGIAAPRIATEGFGEDQPIASNATIEGRRANRRVEIYVQRQPLDG